MVLHIITRLAEGGSSENTILTVSGLNREKYETYLMSGITRPPERGMDDLALKLGINLEVIPELVREIDPSKDLKALMKIYRYIRRYNFDIVHTHTSKAGFIGRIAARLARVPIIIHTPHGHIYYGYFGILKSRLFIMLEKLVAFFTDRIITLTELGKEEHIKYKIAPPGKFVAIYSGIKLEKYSAASVDVKRKKEEIGIKDDQPVIGCVARLVPVKGHIYLIKAAKIVIDALPDVQFILAGDGELEMELKEFSRALGIESNIHFLGRRDDIPELLQIFDIFVLPSLNEGMGRVILEAMAAGKPVIATRVGGIPEIVKDGITGILVPPENPDFLAEAIISLIKNRDLGEKFGLEGKMRLDSKFTSQAMVERIEQLYDELISCKFGTKSI